MLMKIKLWTKDVLIPDEEAFKFPVGCDPNVIGGCSFLIRWKEAAEDSIQLITFH